MANFHEFKKTATKVIKTARKIVEHEAERLHEYSVLADHLMTLQTTYEYYVSPELCGALGSYASLWKKLGDLRSEMVFFRYTYYIKIFCIIIILVLIIDFSMQNKRELLLDL